MLFSGIYTMVNTSGKSLQQNRNIVVEKTVMKHYLKKLVNSVQVLY